MENLKPGRPRVCFLLTTQPWFDFRLRLRQAPALADAGYEVLYVSDGSANDAGRAGLEMVRLSKPQRRLARLTGACNLLPLVLRLRPAAVQLCSIEQLPLGLAIKALSWVRGSQIKVVYDCREDMYHAMRDHKVKFPRGLRVPMASAFRLLEKLASRAFDGLVVSDPALYHIHRGASAGKKVLFLNTPLLSLFPSDFPPVRVRAYDLAVMGSMSLRTGVLDVLDAVAIVAARGKKVTLLLVGALSAEVRETFWGRATALGVAAQIEETGIIPHEEIAGKLAGAKIGLVPLPDMPKFRNNIACKTFEYMACGLPVICSDLPPQRLIVEEGVTGLFHEPGNSRQIADLIVSLLEDMGRAEAMGRAGRRAIERGWSAERDQQRYLRFYERLVGPSGGAPPPRTGQPVARELKV